jgi:hypothetical protein
MKCSAASAKVIADERASKRLPELRTTLPRSEADYLYLRYAGECGRRSVWEAALLTRKGKYCAVAVPPKARQDFRELCVTLLELRYPDWAAAEGADGSFVWDLAEDRLIHSHTSRTDRPYVDGAVPASNGTAVLEEDDIPF